ncbi:MAG: hypothetical protein JWN46_3077 [Acidimicrobiales bacterium]|nr:hypothetical protein [Acidimicrobiales bacterium]
MIFAVVPVLCWAVNLYTIVIIGAVLMSWFPVDPSGAGGSVFRVLMRLTDPVLLPLRRVIPPIGGAIDVSPMIVLLVLQVILRPLVCT